MAVPTIATVTPATGHPGGGTLVRVDGTGFQLPASPPPASEGRTVAPPGTVRVFFDGVEAAGVKVVSSTRVYAYAPRYKPAADAAADLDGLPDAVDVEVRNVGPFGETLGAERVVAAGAYTYKHTPLTSRSSLTRVVRQLVLELMRQIHPNVVLTRSVDFSETPSDPSRRIANAKVPGLFLVGPKLRENKLYRTQVLPQSTSTEGLTRTHASARTVDLVFGIGALADDPNTLLELANAITDFTNRNVWLLVPREQGGAELVRYDLDMEDDVEVDSTPSESNVLSASGTISVAGVDVIGLPDFDADEVLTELPELGSDPEIETSSTV